MIREKILDKPHNEWENTEKLKHNNTFSTEQTWTKTFFFRVLRGSETTSIAPLKQLPSLSEQKVPIWVLSPIMELREKNGKVSAAAMILN